MISKAEVAGIVAGVSFVVIVGGGVGALMGMASVEDDKLKEAKRSEANAPCLFSDKTHEIAAHAGWGVSNLAVRIEGVDFVGPRSHCYNEAQTVIIALNSKKIDPNYPRLIIGASYKVPNQLLQPR